MKDPEGFAEHASPGVNPTPVLARETVARLQARPMILAVAISSSSKASETFPETA